LRRNKGNIAHEEVAGAAEQSTENVTYSTRPKVAWMILVCLVTGLGLAVPAAPSGIPVPTDSNISAVVTRIWESVPRADVPGQVRFEKPYSVAVDAKGRIFISDLGPSYRSPKKVLVLNTNYEVEAIIGNSSDCTVKIPQMSIPGDVAVDSRDRLYVLDLDTEVPFVHILGKNLTYLGSVPISTPDSVLDAPSCIAIDSRDRLIIGIYRGGGQSRILVFTQNRTDPTGGSMSPETEFQLCPPGEECSVYGSPNDITVDPFGRIVIAEGESMYKEVQRVIVLDEDFGWLGSFETVGGDLYRAVVDPSGVFITLDSGGRISFYFPNTTYAGSIGKADPNPGEFSPAAHLILAGPGKLLVPDLNHERLLELTVDLSTLRIRQPPTKIPEEIALNAICFMAIFLVAGGTRKLRRKPLS